MAGKLTGVERDAEIRRKLARSVQQTLKALDHLPTHHARTFHRDMADYRARAERWLAGEAGLIFPERPAWLLSATSKSARVQQEAK